MRSADSTTICSGGSATIHADLTGTGPWLVKWSDESTPDNVSSSPVTRVVSPASTTVYTITSLSDNSGCVAPPTLSGSATVTVNQPPSVTTPAGQTVCVGSTANFTVSAGATTSPNYQWQVDTGGGFGNVSSGTGGNSASYTTATLALGDNNNQYRCIVSSGVACGSPATSGAAILNVSSGGVTINSPPANATNSIGEMAAFSVGASGIGLSFQWQVNTGGGFANVSTGSGGSTSNYTTAVLALADNGSQFQCILTPTCGNASTSSVATLTMIPGNYRTRASGFWTNALTWEESYNSGGNWVSAQITPTAANSTNILIQGSHTVTNTTSISADELVIQSGGLLTVSGSTFTINDGAAAVDCDVLGTIQVLTGGSVVTNAGAGVTFENGSLFQWSNAATPAVPSATWANGSTCKIAATAGGTVNATGVSGQSFYDFTWDTTVAGQSARCRLDIQGSNTVVRRNLAITIPNTASASVTLCNGTNVLLTVGGNVTFVTGAGQNSTKVLLNSAAGQIFFFKVAGNFSAGGFLDGFGSTDSTLEFNGTGNQSLTLPTGSGLITGGAISHQVDNNSILTLNSAISNCKAFAVNNGGQVIFGTNQIANGSMLTLNSTAVIYGNGTNQLANVNTNNYGGTLNITNNLPQVLANGTSFKLFAGGTNNSGSFAAIVPATPGANQVWDTTQLLTNGTLIVASAVVASPVISSAVLSGTDLILSGTNGPANAGYTVFSTTNLAKPLTTWSPVGAGTFNAGGGFSYTNLGTTNPAAFFIIRTP